jgi:hypothetical protein
MITPEQIEQNREIFESILTKNISLSDFSLLDYLRESDFYIAPASSKYHGDYKGGLCEHSLNVYKNIIVIYNNIQWLECGITQSYSTKTLTLISLLHDICKVGIYKESFRNKKKLDEKGEEILNKKGLPIWEIVPYYEVDDNYPLGHGEKSVIILQRYFLLTTEEIMAIRWHMGGYDDITKSYIGNMTANKAFNMYPLITLLHMADLASIFLKLPVQDEKLTLKEKESVFYETEQDRLKDIVE